MSRNIKADVQVLVRRIDGLMCAIFTLFFNKIHVLI